MKKFIIIFFLLITSTYSKETISFRADDWCPYNCELDNKKHGYLVEILRRVFNSENYIIDYKTMNWSRAILDARGGKVNGIIGAYKSDAEDFIFPTVPLGTSQEVFIVKNENQWNYSGVDSLSKVTLGVIRDYSYGGNLDAYIVENKTNFNKVQIVSGDMPFERNIRKLLNNRISAVIENENVANWFLKRNPSLKDKLRIAGKRFVKTEVYVAFSPATPEKSRKYARMLTSGFEEMKRSGELKEILESYGLTMSAIK